MGFKEVMQSLLTRRRDPSEPQPDIPDDMTTDKVLRGLRRQRRVQLEGVEKDHLKEQILAFQRREEGFSLKDRGKSILNEGVKKRPPNKPQRYLGRSGFL